LFLCIKEAKSKFSVWLTAGRSSVWNTVVAGLASSELDNVYVLLQTWGQQKQLLAFWIWWLGNTQQEVNSFHQGR